MLSRTLEARDGLGFWLLDPTMNTLSRREEETLLKKTKEAALKQCDPIVKGMINPCLHCAAPQMGYQTLPNVLRDVHSRLHGSVRRSTGWSRIACSSSESSAISPASVHHNAIAVLVLRLWRRYGQNMSAYETKGWQMQTPPHHDRGILYPPAQTPFCHFS